MVHFHFVNGYVDITQKLHIFFAKCNRCSKFVTTRPQSSLRNHLVQEHSNELTKEEKKDKCTEWTWDHFTIKNTLNLICNICEKVVTFDTELKNLNRHLKEWHVSTLKIKIIKKLILENIKLTVINSNKWITSKKI